MGAYWTVKPMQAVLQEATHAADFLLHAHGARSGMLGTLAGTDYYRDSFTTPSPDPELWSANAQQLAKASVESNRLGGSLRAEWSRLQNAFRAFGNAGAYRGPRKADETDDYAQLVKDGFTSRYGAASVGEDIAEFAGWMLAAPLTARSFCCRLSDHTHQCRYRRRGCRRNIRSSCGTGSIALATFP